MKYLDDFNRYLIHAKGYSEHTARAYLSDLRALSQALSEDILTASSEDINNYLMDIAEKGIKPNTRRRKAAAISHFFSYAERKGMISTNPATKLDRPKAEEKEMIYLSDEDIEKFLKVIHNSRDKSIFTLFICSGMRLSELCNLRMDDVTFYGRNGQPSLQIKGKGGHIRTIPLNDTADKALSQWLYDSCLGRMSQKNPYIFTDFDDFGEIVPIDRRTVQELFRKYAVASGVYREGLTVHKLRHTAATMLLNNGTDIRVIQKILGHKDIRSTEIYTHVVDEAVVKAINNISI